MADFSGQTRFAVAITADDETQAGAAKAEKTISDRLRKPVGAARRAGAEAADAFSTSFGKTAKTAQATSAAAGKSIETGIGRSFDRAKKKTDDADKAVRTLRERIAQRWHVGGMGKAFDNLREARRSFGDFAEGFGGFFTPAAGITGLLAGGGLMEIMAGYGSRASQIAHASRRLGVSPELLQEWQGAAKIADVDPSAVTAALGSVTEKQYDYRAKLPGATEAHLMALEVQQKTGVDMVTALGKDQNTFLRTLAQALAKLDPGAQGKIVAAFGVEGIWDILLNPAKLQSLLSGMHQIGVQSKKQVEDAEAWRESFNEANLATQHFADTVEDTLGNAFKPSLDAYKQWISELGKNKGVVDGVKTSVEGLAGVFSLTFATAVGKAIGKLIMFNRWAWWMLPLMTKGDTPGADVPGGSGSPEQLRQIQQETQKYYQDHPDADTGPLDDWNKAHPDYPIVVPGKRPPTAAPPAPASGDAGQSSHRRNFDPVGRPRFPSPQSDRSNPDMAAIQPVADLIARGEGNYSSVNRGRAHGYRSGTEDLADMTLDQVMAAQRAGRFNAAGRYQITKDTLALARTALGLHGDEKFGPALQDQIFARYLLGAKRPAIRDYLSGKSDDLIAAERAAAREWASVADPDKPGTQSHYSWPNRASISVTEIGRALRAARRARNDSNFASRSVWDLDRLVADLDRMTQHRDQFDETSPDAEGRRHGRRSTFDDDDDLVPVPSPHDRSVEPLPPTFFAAYRPDANAVVEVRFVDVPKGVDARIAHARGVGVNLKVARSFSA